MITNQVVFIFPLGSDHKGKSYCQTDKNLRFFAGNLCVIVRGVQNTVQTGQTGQNQPVNMVWLRFFNFKN